MSKEDCIIPWEKGTDLTEEQKTLMFEINRCIGLMFQEDDPLVKPSNEMNRPRFLKCLEFIRDNPSAHIGYDFYELPICEASRSIWLNLQLTAWFPKESGCPGSLSFLTPNQTHWICLKLQDDKLMVESVEAHARRALNNLKQAIIRIENQLNDGEHWTDLSKSNMVFDVVSAENWCRGLYTSSDIYRTNVCPPLIWSSPIPEFQDMWQNIILMGQMCPTDMSYGAFAEK
ncbi:MAG: hypothetical protein MRY49_00205 [Candidatus Pacebacteria bacterium]|nr:hypothetical protein [Candidatus Paceibacterota bacterium]